MGMLNIRSLLLAALVVLDCIACSTSRHHLTHNVNVHRSRHRRQGAGLFLSASYVLPGGEGSGPWGEWGKVSPCSRTCGGGVASQKRICLGVGSDGRPQCTGGDTKYFSCQTQDCPEGSLDFRAEQCAEFNDKKFRGNIYEWVPYTKAANPCELNCMPHAERFYFRQKPKVVDGTRCNDESFDVCVDGTCQPVGCDMMLGSNAREDKCRQCRGNGTNCHTISGVLDSQELRKGYNDVMLIPQGATNIYISEVRPSENYLALRAKQDNVYYLNGDYHIDFPRSLVIAGALWHYERRQQGFAAPDKLRSLGPTTEPLYLSLLLQEVNVGIEYEYSVPSALAPPPNQQYIWVHEEFSRCTAACGGGYQTRVVSCRTRDDLQPVDDKLCEENFKPPTNQTCNTDACGPQWIEGEWGPCSKPCGEGGTRSRQVHCQKIIASGTTMRFPSLVADKECFDRLGPKPELYQQCNQNETCPTWFTGPWKPCDKLCGDGKQTRQVVCHQKINGRVKVFEDNECADEKPAVDQPCILHPCDGVDWVLSEWSGCDTCLSTYRTRMAQCATKDHKLVDSNLCSYHPKPTLQEPCDKTKLPACEVQWYATQWSNCSVECGKGVQSRRIFCGLFDGASVLKVDDSRCNNISRYNDTKECEVPKDKCPAKWYAGPWSECTKECGGGEQYRRVMCLNGGKEVKDCDEETILDSTQSCNIGPCNEDDMLPVDVKSTPIMDDYEYEDCDEEEEEEGEEVGAEELSTGSTVFEELMFSDSPSTDIEGSGGGSTMFDTTFTSDETETQTDMTDTETATDISTSESMGSSEFTEDTSSTESAATDESTTSGTTENVSGSTESTSAETDTTNTKTSVRIKSTTEKIDSTSEISDASGTTTGETSTSETSESNILTTEVTETTSESSDATGSTTEVTETTSDASGSTTEITETTSESSDATGSTTEVTETTSDASGSTTEITETTSESSDATGSTTEVTETTSDASGSTTEITETTSESSDATGSTTEVTETTSDASGSTTEITETTSESSDATGSTTEVTETTSDASGSTTEITETTSESSDATGSTTEVTETTSESTESSKSTTEETGTASDITEYSGSTTEEGTGITEISASTTEETASTSEFTESSSTSSTETVSTSEITESSGSTTEVTETSTDVTESSGSTAEETGSTSESPEETGSTSETTESSGSTELMSESSSVTEETGGSTPWDWSSTVEVYTKRPRCKPRKKAKCIKSKFGCCPDKRTPAAGPFDEGCPNPKTCKESKFGCCPDGVSAASGPHNKDCPVAPCSETLFGCCKSDNITAAEGNDQEGCPEPVPACVLSKHGCCKDGKTKAKGLNKKGCPETGTKNETIDVRSGDCEESKYGCCYDNETDAAGPDGEGCPCSITQFGCCPDGVSTASGPTMEGCVLSCNTSAYGCCPDGETPAHGPEYEGCCLQYAFGCCPDNYKPAEGPHLEGCGCQHAHFGCCPDNVTIARGPDGEGCGCKYTEFGCCPDRHTPAQGPDYEGCACYTYQFGCCPDGVTTASGPDQQGCRCQQSTYGCCGDGTTAAKGPDMEGCDCSNSKYGCCPDGVTDAKGEKFLNCTDKPENRQAACALANDRGSCRNYSVYWFYDMTYGGCSRFWYGGCEGNGNRFLSQEECEDVCVQPAPKDACNLPMVKGVCSGYHVRWYYDSSREQCSQFVFGGCLGNANNFNTKELCQERCEPEKTEDQCNLPIERGPCAGNYQRWGYSSSSRSCSQFTYGGCGGNPNRFTTEAACLQRCNPPGAPQKECMLAQEVGNCTEKIPTWSFSQTENRCVPFYFSGCGGNGNRYESERACADACPGAYVQEVCTLPALTGECADYTMRWFFDTTKSRCRQFYYGGCGGNENNFRSEYECESRCSEQPATTTVSTAVRQESYKSEYCFLERDSGPCTRTETRWAYDDAAGACTQFQYGGCGGNMNNFPSIEHCQYYCGAAKDACQLPMVAGPCEESLTRWFYDASTDSCSQFAYGGCEGNDNRFNSVEECENRCRSGGARTVPPTTTVAYPQRQENLPNQCQILATLEECQEPGQVWYFDESQQACVEHTNPSYGLACRHTGVFSSEEACERACGAFRELEVCRYPMDAGPCTSSIPKVYYDLASGRCEQYLYSGCHGGPNRFSTQEECEQICKPNTDPCTQQPEPGNCLGSLEMWYYDERRDDCHRFVYGGCNGNDNRFETREECVGRCKKASSPTTTLATQVSPVTAPTVVDMQCQTPRSLIPCGTSERIYYFDTRTQACVAGDFGGCGYSNSYKTEEECERSCGAFRGLDVCGSRLDPGPCVSLIQKVYFDASSGRCLSFVYGGCHGGPNRFSSVEECEVVCGGSRPDAVCLLPVETGRSCGDSARRWHYSAANAECIAFVYSGCDGNENNFHSYEECSSHCKTIISDDTRYNEVLPDCEEFDAECASIRCEYGIQRTRTSGGCERCTCVSVEIDCAPLRSECDRLKCTYGIEKLTGDDGCERCRCIDHPCSNKRCPAGERCVASVSRDPDTGEGRYTTDCRVVNKTGECPLEDRRAATESQCRRECNDDADCVGASKCCVRGCSHLCLGPRDNTSPSPLITSSVPRPTTYAPELPQAPRASVDTEPEATVNEGDKATLRCLFHGNPPPKITWRRGEITIDGDVGRYRLLSDGTLEIVSVYRNDTGVYICIADNELGRATQEIQLQVNDPVEGPAGIAGVPDSVVVGELGQPLNIRCLAYGYPTPQIYWYRGTNGPMVPYSSSLYEARGNILQIRKLNTETVGEYLCQAYNGKGKAAAWPFVVQAYSPDGRSNHPYLVTREKEVIVTPRPALTEATTTTEPEIKVPVYSVPVSTRLEASSPRVSAGSEINLPCEVDGYPVPVVYWTKDGVRITTNDRMEVTEARLTISRANTNDTGVYGCHAANAYSSHYSSVQINVEGLYLPPNCVDNKLFANCDLIVRSKFCYHKYYSRFCCRSCVEAGMLNPMDIELQADQPWSKKK